MKIGIFFVHPANFSSFKIEPRYPIFQEVFPKSQVALWAFPTHLSQSALLTILAHYINKSLVGQMTGNSLFALESPAPRTMPALSWAYIHVHEANLISSLVLWLFLVLFLLPL